MLHIERFQVNMLQENCYVVSDETKECVIIGAAPSIRKSAKLLQYIKENQLKPVHLLVTHGHLDHNFGNNTIYQEFGLKPEVSAADENLMKGLAKQAGNLLSDATQLPVSALSANSSRTEECQVRQPRVGVIATPDHSSGSVTFYCEAETRSHTGDTLFPQLYRQNRFPWRQHVPHHQQSAPSRSVCLTSRFLQVANTPA